MSNKIVKYGDDARTELAKGADFLANAVKSTIGPFGQNWFLQKRNAITNDGVSIAREIELTDEIQNRGVSALREAAIKTNDEAGDGTTTAIVLAQAIYNAVSKYLSKEGVMAKKPASELIKKIEEERQYVTDELMKASTPIENENELISSAVVSVEDQHLGELIGKAQWELGKDGILIAEEVADRTSSIEKVHGIRIDNGFGTSSIINNQEKQMLEVENTKVVLTSYSIKDFADWQKVMKLIDMIVKGGSNVVTIIARAWSEECIRYCLLNINNAQGGVKIYPLNAPYQDMTERMRDIQAVVGGSFYDSETTSLEDLNLSDVGFASKIVARRFDATITGMNNEKTESRVSKRIEELSQKKEGSGSDFEKKNLDQRIAQLQNGFSVVKVGSPSDMERKRLFDKCEDAVNAVRAAYQEGTVKGGGLAFKEISESMDDSFILKRPLMAVYEQIMALAPSGFIIEDWVRDPVKVLRVALEKACIAASSFATAGGVVVTEQPKPIDQLLRARGGDNSQ